MNSLNTFYKFIASNSTEVELLLNNIDDYYVKREKKKLDKHGNPVLKNGHQKIRVYFEVKQPLLQIQKKIHRNILSKLIISNCAHGSVKRRSVISNTKPHKSKKYHFATDLVSFFDFVTSQKVYALLRKDGHSPDVARAITQLTTYKGHIPQGAPTSPVLSNLVFREIDTLIDKLCSQSMITYTRYVDDLFFSSNNDFKDLTNSILLLLQEGGFLINHKKTFYKIGTIETTGVRVGHNYLKPKKELLEKLNDPDISQESKIGIQQYINRIQSS